MKEGEREKKIKTVSRAHKKTEQPNDERVNLFIYLLK